MQFDGRTKLFVVLAALFLTCLLVGDIIGGKLYGFRMFDVDFTLSMGMIPFPIVFVLTDTLNEFYGKRAARFVTLVGAVMLALTILFFAVAGVIPWAPFTRDPAWDGFNPDAWERIFANSTRILWASVGAYLLSQFLDIYVFAFLKRLTHARFLWLRATGSTVVSQLIDTIIITSLAFGHLMTFDQIVDVILASYVIKLCWAVGMTPVIYGLHELLERVFGIPPLSSAERAADVGGIKPA